MVASPLLVKNDDAGSDDSDTDENGRPEPKMLVS
jgi:hypothetical protein